MKTKLEQIEPYTSLAFSETAASPEEVTMTLPLTGNRNDKGTVFGGSIYSAMVLAAWRLCEERSAAEGWQGDIFVKDSSTSFLRPACSDMRVRARLDAPPAATRRGNVAFDASVEARDTDGEVCASMRASFRLLDRERNES